MHGLNSRERYSMNFNWLFHIGSQDLQHISCDSSAFSLTPNTHCQGLITMKLVAKNDVNGCANTCCANPTCSFFQMSSGECSIGDMISIYNEFNWRDTCQKNTTSNLYQRTNIPDTNPNNFIATSKNYDDSFWKTVNLPHDYIVNGTVNQYANPQDPRPGSHGYLPKNTSWYRKHFSLPQQYINDTTLWIDFDGIFRNSIMFLNGKFLGNHSSGYTSFRYYLDSEKYALEFGNNSDNVLSIFIDATASEGWWYEGGGIYRNVFFNKANKIHFKPWYVYLPTNVTNINSDGIHGNGNLIINATIMNDYDFDSNINVKFEIVEPDGNILKTLTMSNIAVKANSNITVAPWYYAENIELWSVDNPSLYKVNCTIYNTQNEEIDFITVSYGYRKVVFDVNNGLYLNDKYVKMKGFCNHQDFGGTGVATPERINRYRIQHLKNMGGNSWRMSHNPPNPELLDFADEYGYLIWDENRHFGNSQQWLKDQRDMILRDRNHPSIIIWSICNEAGCMEPGYTHNTSQQLGNITLMFKEMVQKYDGIYNNNKSNWGYSRAVSAAMDTSWGDAMSPYLDIQGINYHYDQYSNYHKSYPNQSIISSECGSGGTDRNEYVSSATTGHISAYSLSTTNCWVPQLPNYVIGSFEWTGFDYKGEPGPYNWPTINSHHGVMDLIGFPKDVYWYYRSVWQDVNDEIILHIVPNTWNNDTLTDPINVRIYTNCKFIEIFINNKSISNGKQQVEANEYYSTNITWEKGEIECKCYDSNNNVLHSTSLETTNEAYGIKLEWEYPYNKDSKDNNTIIGDGQDVCLINVFVVDNKNRIVPNASHLINFSISDESIAFILGVGNGDSACHQRDKSSFRSVYHGKAKILIQSMLNKSGKVILTAKSDGLISGNIDINIQPPTHKILTI